MASKPQIPSWNSPSRSKAKKPRYQMPQNFHLDMQLAYLPGLTPKCTSRARDLTFLTAQPPPCKAYAICATLPNLIFVQIVRSLVCVRPIRDRDEDDFRMRVWNLSCYTKVLTVHDCTSYEQERYFNYLRRDVFMKLEEAYGTDI
jgi:hypothetical protein